jgi:GDP-6-deoxy-D-talose 4-dehydrogenase
MDSCLILGGSGFIGEYLTHKLAGIKKFKVLSTFNSSQPAKKITGVEYIKADVSDPTQITPYLLESDYLIILTRPDKRIISNIISTNKKFKRILFTSTLLIYPDSPALQDENTKPLPANDYEKEKIIEEEKLKEYSKKTGSILTIARLTNVYGDTKNRALMHWILNALINNTGFNLNNEGKPVRDFIFVEDAAEYLKRLLLAPQEKDIEIYNVCTGKGCSINQVIKMVEKISGKKLQIKKGKQTDEKTGVVGDNRKIIDLTGYKISYDLESGLKKALKNYSK